jgi:cholesterol transport system auxiliary component
VFPKAEPVQLYRFGGDLPSAPRPPAAANTSFSVEALPITFEGSAAGDRILTTTGDEAAFIKDARWVSSASSLFEQALSNAFDADPGPARLMARGEAVRPNYFLKLEVRRFEVQYRQGQGAPPTIQVDMYASLSALTDRTLAGERLFTASVPADANRGGRIAAAYNQAVNDVLQSLVKWVDAKGVG